MSATRENLDLNESVEMKTAQQIDEESELNNTSVPVDSNADEINATTTLAEASNENGVDEATGSLMENGNKSLTETSQEDMSFGTKVKDDAASSYDELIVSHPSLSLSLCRGIFLKY